MSQDGPYPGLKGHFPGETEEVLPTLVAKLVAGGALVAPDAGLLAKLGASAGAAPAAVAPKTAAPAAPAPAPAAAPKPAAAAAPAPAPAPKPAAAAPSAPGSSQRSDPVFKPADVDQALSGILGGKEDSQLRAAVSAPSPLSDRISARLGSVAADAPAAAPVAAAPKPAAAAPAPAAPKPAPVSAPAAAEEADEPEEQEHAGDRIGNRIVTRVDQTMSVSSLEEVLSGMETPKPGGKSKGDLSGDWFGDFGKKPSTGSTFDNLMDSVSGAFTDTAATPAEAAPPPPPPAPKPAAVAPPPPPLPPVAPMAATTVAPAAPPQPQLDDAGLDSLLEGIVPAAKPSRPVPTKKQAERLYQRVIELTDEQLLDAADELLLDVVEDLELAKHPVPPKLKKRVEEIKTSKIGDASKPVAASHASMPEETDHDEVIVVEPGDAVFGPPAPAPKAAPAPAPKPAEPPKAAQPEPPKPAAKGTVTISPTAKPAEAPKPTVTVQQPAPPVAPTKTEAPKPAAPAPQKPAAPAVKVMEAPVSASPTQKVVDTKVATTKTLAPSPEAVYDETIEKAKDAGDRRTLVLSREEMEKRGKQLVGAAETPKYQIVVGYLGITLAVVSGLVYLLFVLYTGKL